MTPQRARDIISACQDRIKNGLACGPWCDQLDKVMSTEERQEVTKVWNTMPGNTSFVDALGKVAKADLPIFYGIYRDKPGVRRIIKGRPRIPVSSDGQDWGKTEFRFSIEIPAETRAHAEMVAQGWAELMEDCEFVELQTPIWVAHFRSAIQDQDDEGRSIYPHFTKDFPADTIQEGEKLARAYAEDQGDCQFEEIE